MSNLTRWAAALLMALVVLAGACTVSESSQPIEIDQADLPAELQTITVPASSTVPTEANDQSVAIYYVRSGESETSLELIEKPAEARNRQLAIKALLSSPTSPEERADNLINHLGLYSFTDNDGSLVPLELLGATADPDEPDVFLIFLNGPIDLESGDVLTQAFAQLVFTATENPRVRAVRIFNDGEQIQIPVENDLVSEATRDDYPQLLASLEEST